MKNKVWYKTEYRVTVRKRTGPKAGHVVREWRVYTSKTLTPKHKWIRDRYQGSRTLKCTAAIGGRPLEFGPYEEVIAMSLIETPKIRGAA